MEAVWEYPERNRWSTMTLGKRFLFQSSTPSFGAGPRSRRCCSLTLHRCASLASSSAMSSACAFWHFSVRVWLAMCKRLQPERLYTRISCKQPRKLASLSRLLTCCAISWMALTRSWSEPGFSAASFNDLASPSRLSTTCFRSLLRRLRDSNGTCRRDASSCDSPVLLSSDNALSDHRGVTRQSCAFFC